MLLLIDTSSERAVISLASAEHIIAAKVDDHQMNHAAFVQPAIQQLLQDNNISFTDIHAIAVMAGPGSYTGLRVGMSSAKGLCYATGLPLISINKLEALACAEFDRLKNNGSLEHGLLVCPMIDARRMEVYTAVYDSNLRELMSPQASILDENSFAELLTEKKILFTGNGAVKFLNLVKHANILSGNEIDLTDAFAALAHKSLAGKNFTDLAYGEPFYLKGIYVESKK
jgi:tRNA threonylcarbamoyladenosine biosynthesis protein TsaB